MWRGWRRGGGRGDRHGRCAGEEDGGCGFVGEVQVGVVEVGMVGPVDQMVNFVEASRLASGL